jgi:RNA polymerase sigma factor (sigma-70 family)
MLRALSDDEAWIVSHNLPLVEHYLRGLSYDEATWQDLRAAGYLGLCHAIRRYDPAIAMWSTHAYYWIRRYVQLERYGASLLHVPNYHRSIRQHPKHRVCRSNHGAAAKRMLAARRVQWDDREAVAVLAVAQPSDVDTEHQSLIRPHLARLPALHREIVQRVVMDSEDAHEVAIDLGLSVGSVMQLKRYGVQRLKLMMLEDRPEWAQR